MNSNIKLYYWKNVLAGILIIIAGVLSSWLVLYFFKEPRQRKNQTIYLQQIKKDFLHHKEDVTTIYNINKNMVILIDSLLHTPGANADTTIFRRIMNTRPYDLTILAYKNLMMNNNIDDESLKIKIVTSIAQFEGLARWKLESIDWQWDKTARPYIYNYTITTKNNTGKNPLADPVFREVLFDRRMFAHDVEKVTPRMLASIDSVTNAIDAELKK